MNRREFNMTVTAGTGAMLMTTAAATAGEHTTADIRIVDTNISLFQWPFRRLPLDDPQAIVEKLRSLGIRQAWAGTFEGLLHRDITAANRRLAETCVRHAELIPIGSINPALPGWEEDLQRCIEEHQMPGVRLHPNYHGYPLDDPGFIGLLEQTAAAGRFVQLAAAMEDTRTQPSMLRVPDVDLTPLPDVMERVPAARVQILNARLPSPLLDKLAATPGLFFDTARVEGTDGVVNLLRAVPAGRVMFGSHAPFLIPEAALIRVHESGQLDDGELQAVLGNNASHLLGNTHV